jgi:hypothetical protein
MTYSLIGADRTTHIKIVTLALAGSLLVGFAVHASQTPDPSDKAQGVAGNLVAKVPSHVATARSSSVTVCRFSSI